MERYRGQQEQPKPSIVDRWRLRRLDRQIDNAEHYLQQLALRISHPSNSDMDNRWMRMYGSVAESLYDLRVKRQNLSQKK